MGSLCFHAKLHFGYKVVEKSGRKKLRYFFFALDIILFYLFQLLKGGCKVKRSCAYTTLVLTLSNEIRNTTKILVNMEKVEYGKKTDIFFRGKDS